MLIIPISIHGDVMRQDDTVTRNMSSADHYHRIFKRLPDEIQPVNKHSADCLCLAMSLRDQSGVQSCQVSQGI